MSTTSTSASEGITSGVQTFISEHKKLIIGVAAASVATALAVVLYTNSSALPLPDLERGDAKKPSKKKKNKTSKKESPTPPLNPNGPILEEIPEKDRATCKDYLRLLAITYSLYIAPQQLSDSEIKSLSSEVSILELQIYMCMLTRSRNGQNAQQR